VDNQISISIFVQPGGLPPPAVHGYHNRSQTYPIAFEKLLGLRLRNWHVQFFAPTEVCQVGSTDGLFVIVSKWESWCYA
jgi:hypothetical protein